MPRSYLPAIVFLVLGGTLGVVFGAINARLGPSLTRRREARAEPYECGLPSDFRQGFRFGISFYLVAIMFIIFDIEVILLVPTALVLEEFGVHALVAIGLFFFFIGVAFVYDWRRGVLDWKAGPLTGDARHDRPHDADGSAPTPRYTSDPIASGGRARHHGMSIAGERPPDGAHLRKMHVRHPGPPLGA